MSRNPKIEAILEAWWNLDHSEPGKKAENELRLNALLDERIGANPKCSISFTVTTLSTAKRGGRARKFPWRDQFHQRDETWG